MENVMDRLTARNRRGKAYFPYCFREDTCEGLGTSEKCGTCELTHMVCEKLAEYEDLEQIERKGKDIETNNTEREPKEKMKVLHGYREDIQGKQGRA
jgi:hypothetical protein